MLAGFNQCPVVYYQSTYGMNDAATCPKKVHTVPDLFTEYQGYNDVKRKQNKEKPMAFSELYQHSEVLFAICCRPVMKSNQQWIKICEAIKDVAECLRCYAEHLKDQL